MSILDDFMDDHIIQDAFGIFDRTEQESLDEVLRDEFLSMEDDECEIFSSKGLHGRIGDV